MTINQSFSDAVVRDQRLRLAIEQAGIGTWDLDLFTQELIWSDRTRALFGQTIEQHVDWGFFLSLLEPEDRSLSTAAIKRSVETGCRFDLQYRLGGALGTPHWICARGGLVSGTDGRPRHLSGIMIDIDDEKQGEETLKTRESHLRSILDTVPQSWKRSSQAGKAGGRTAPVRR